MNTLFTWLEKTDLDNNAAIPSLAKGHSQPFDRIVVIASTWEENWS